MTPFNVLISSAGRRIVLLRAFRAALSSLGLSGQVFASDMSRLSACFHEADEAFLVPRCTDAAFIPEVLKICRERKIRLIVPTIDPELAVYAAHKDAFAAEGVTVAVSSAETIGITRDKRRTHDWLIASGLPTVRQSTPEEVLASPSEWTFPLLVKPRAGSLSAGVAVVTSDSELRHATRAGDFIVQTIAPGMEHTIDFLANRAGKLVCAVPRRRLEVRGGEISKGVTVRSAVLEDIARRVCESLPGAYGCLNVQVFHDPESGELNIIEVNARFGGGFPLSWRAGADYPRWLIEEILNLPSTASQSSWRDGVVMLRYDDAIFTDAKSAGLS